MASPRRPLPKSSVLERLVPSRLRAAAGVKPGFALVIVLAIIALLAVLVISFFSETTSNRAVEASRNHRIKASVLAQSGLDYVVGMIIAELSAGGSSDAVPLQNGDKLFQPKSGDKNVPARRLAATISPTDGRFFNLIRQSVPGADALASNEDTTEPSKNARAVSPARWNEPRLLEGDGFTDKAEIPHWIYVSRRDGLVGTPGPDVIGRFAYNAYWIGGLLNANVAGFPSTISATQRSQLAGSVASADLAALPGLSGADVGRLLTLRNPDATGSAAAYIAYVQRAARDGWRSPKLAATGTSPAISSLFFASRQDLIAFAQNREPAFADALPFLTHFSRGVTAPTINPTLQTPAIDYYTLTRPPNVGTANAFTPGVRTAVAFTRSDGTRAEAGDALMNRPFALNRLKGLGKNGVDASVASTMVGGEVVPATAATIQRDFGLRWNEAEKAWDYVGTTGAALQTSIKRLDQVAADGCEPNFVELLKAAILRGSLARSGGNTASNNARDTSADAQIVQIAANIIDQYDADSLPTRIRFAGREDLIGVENLPLIYGVNQLVYRRAQDLGPVLDPRIGGWFQPILWNPHRNAPASYGGLSFRFYAEGVVKFVWRKEPGFYRFESAARSLSSTTGAVFPLANVSYQDPTILYRLTQQDPPQGTNCAIDELAQWNNAGSPGNRFVRFGGVFAAEVNAPDSRSRNGATNQSGGVDGNGSTAFIDVSAGVTFNLEVNDGSGWRPCSKMSDVRASPEQASPAVSAVNYPINGLFTLPSDYYGMWGRVDPRTSRFGVGLGQNWVMNGRFYNLFTLATPTSDPLASPKPNGGTYSQGVVYFNEALGGAPRISGTGIFPGLGAQGTAYQLATMADNLPGTPPANPSPLAGRPAQSPSGVYYDDNDGVRRRAEGAYASFVTNSRQRLPIVLDRAFTSVAELGFACRDLPWKNVDFFTAESADAFLLDVFSIEEEPAITEGKISPNRVPPAVLSALLRGARKDPLVPGDLISSAEADSIGAAYATALTAKPAVGKAGIVNEFISNPAITFSGNEIKALRESIVRSLDACDNGRTWNVFVDVVAQTGRPAADGRFVVEGEQRSWLSCAIDRVTGRVVDSQKEKVNE